MRTWLALILGVVSVCVGRAPGAEPASLQSAVDTYCISCHDRETNKGGLNLEAIAPDRITDHTEIWEKVVRKLERRQMPPAGKKRPDELAYASILSQIVTPLDQSAAQHPNPGRTDTIRRLTRTEYQNAIRDLLSLEIDATMLLPADESSHGFDNVTVATLSPTLLDRYVSAAQKISRLTVGGAQRAPGGDTIRVKPDITQDDHIEGLPIGTRGGALIHYTFPRDGEYEIQVRLTRDRNEAVEGLHEACDLEMLLDRQRLQLFTVKPPTPGKGYENVDAHLKLRVTVKAGPHDLGVTFVKNPSELLLTTREPYDAHFNMHRHPRINPAVYQVSITGPFADGGAGDSPSRQRVFVARPKTADQEEACAKQILATVMRRAYRRPVNDADVARILTFYQDARHDGDFDSAIEAALSAVLVSHDFLFRVEHDPSGITPHTAYRISDFELASRLSFFLWSSIPDDQLLAVAERGELHEPQVLARETRRMLADSRSRALVTSFAEQWLHLRNLDSITPDGRLFPDFDDNLRQAMRQETELLFDEVLREDRRVLTLLKSDHAWLNERLAKHYDIPNVYGTRFRKVQLAPDSERGGLLRQGSVLTVTSYATRTSPVLRGKWILDNLFGAPPAPPPPNVPTLKENTVSSTLPMRARLAEHRANAACASCHNAMDPVGFALENYDAVGRWRTMEDDSAVDVSGGLPDGSQFSGVSGMEKALLDRPDIFVSTLTEKLLTYALGRGIEYYDAPAVREAVRAAKASDYRFSAIIVSIVSSPEFQMRTSP